MGLRNRFFSFFFNPRFKFYVIFITKIEKKFSNFPAQLSVQSTKETRLPTKTVHQMERLGWKINDSVEQTTAKLMEAQIL